MVVRTIKHFLINYLILVKYDKRSIRNTIILLAILIMTHNKSFTSNLEAITLYNKATLLLTQKKYEKAVVLFKKSLKLEECADAWLNLGTCYKYLDLDSLCLEAFKKAASGLHSHTNKDIKALALNNIGLMQYVNGNDVLAEKSFDSALEIIPSGLTTVYGIRLPVCYVKYALV